MNWLTNLRWRIYLWWHGYCWKHVVEKEFYGYDPMDCGMACPLCTKEWNETVERRIARAKAIFGGQP